MRKRIAVGLAVRMLVLALLGYFILAPEQRVAELLSRCRTER